jgi:hypothetical protein
MKASRPLIAGMLTAMITSTVLAARLLQLGAVDPAAPSMRAMTALLLLFLALHVLARHAGASLLMKVSRYLVWLVVTTTLVVLGLYLLKSPLEARALVPAAGSTLLADARISGLPSPHSALALLLLGLSLLYDGLPLRHKARWINVSLFAVGAVLWFVAFGYLVNATAMYALQSDTSTGMSLLSVFCILVLMIGISGLDDSYDLTWRLLRSSDVGGVSARILLPIALLLPLVMAWALMLWHFLDPGPQTFAQTAGVLACTGIILAGHVLYAGWQLRRHEHAMLLLLKEKEKAQHQLDATRSRNQELREALVTMCAWSNQVKDGEHWISVAEFLHRKFGIMVSHGISPAELAKQLENLEADKTP